MVSAFVSQKGQKQLMWRRLFFDFSQEYEQTMYNIQIQFCSSYDLLLLCCSALQSIPDLPEFALSLRPEGYELPSTDSIWENINCQPQIQSLKEHLNDDEDQVDTK